MIDGNTAALDRHIREEDQLADQDAKFERARNDLENDLFEAFVTGKGGAAVDEINDQLLYHMDPDGLITTMRAMLVAECDRPVSDRGAISYEFLKGVLQIACENIAGRCVDQDDIERLRHDLEV